MFEGTGFVHGLFGLLGMVPGPVGIAANLADSLVYAVVDKDMLMAGCSFLNALSMGTTSYLNACIKANRGVRMAGAINTVVTMASNTMNFAQCSNDMMAASFAMYDKYVIRGEAFTAATFWEVAGLGLSAAGCVGSGASLRGNIIQTAALVNKPGGYPRINSNMADAVPQAGSSSRNPVQKGSLQQTPAGTGGVILVFDINLSPSSGSISAAQLADGACFTAGTQVLTDSGHKAIEEIHAGDRVLAENPETGEQGYREVLRTYVRQQEVIVHVILGQTEIETTREHPFYVEGTGFVEASRLKAGDLVRTADGSSLAVSAVETEYLAEPVSVYNLEVEGWHTYYVSDSGVLVHNMCARSVTGSHGKLSGNLDWDAVVGRHGETRQTHVTSHETNNLSKPLHGVFYGNAQSTINNAWANRESGYMITKGNTDIYVIPYQNAGYSGGFGGQGENLNYVTIVTQKGTNNIITGFPGSGCRYTESWLIGGD